MEQVMVVSSTEQGKRLLLQLVAECGFTVSNVAQNGITARQVLESNQYDLVIVNAPLSDEHGETVARLAEEKHATVILLVKPEYAEPVRERIKDTGIFLITKPLKRAVFLQLLQCIQMQKIQRQQLVQERDKIKQQMQEIHLLNRAKLVLIQVLKLSELQAHRYIEKQAMDLRITKREVAEGIINTYET